MRGQLGLKPESTEGRPVDNVVVDGIERPSEELKVEPRGFAPLSRQTACGNYERRNRQPNAPQAERFREIAAVCRPGVFHFALAALKNPDAAEDVTQTCFLRACDAWPRFRGDSSLRTWLIAIAVNLIRDAKRCPKWEYWSRRQQRRFEGLQDEIAPDPRSSPEERWLAKERVTEVRKAVAADLSPNQRMIFVLHFVKEMSVPEIAATTGIRNATVRVHLSRATRRIRRKLSAL
jgi:RNA polymerase sigma-70 factor (ECF subfamily)